MTDLNTRAATLVYGAPPPLPEPVLIGAALWGDGNYLESRDASMFSFCRQLSEEEVQIRPSPFWSSGPLRAAIPGAVCGAFMLTCPWPRAVLMVGSVTLCSRDLRVSTGTVGVAYLQWLVMGRPPVDTSRVRWVPPDYEHDPAARLTLLEDARRALRPHLWRGVCARLSDPYDWLDVGALQALVEICEAA